MKIEALHEFHDEQFAKEWTSRFVPTAERMSLFGLILETIDRDPLAPLSILELGIGPGFLAEFILSKRTKVSYEGLDFSQAILELATDRLQPLSKSVSFTQADLTMPNWIELVKMTPQSIITTWALHDLLSKQNIYNVYKSVYDLLPSQGTFVNGDFIKPEQSQFIYEAGRIKPSEHLEMLNAVGFAKVDCLKIFEANLEQPTTANNYACFYGD